MFQPSLAGSAPAFEKVPLQKADERIGRLAEDAQQDDREEHPVDSTVVLGVDEQEAEAHGRRNEFGRNKE